MQGFDDGFVQSCKLAPSDCHLSDIEPSISSPIGNLSGAFIQDQDHPSPETEHKTSSDDKSTIKHGKKSRSAAVSRSRPPVRRSTIPAPDKEWVFVKDVIKKPADPGIWPLIGMAIAPRFYSHLLCWQTLTEKRTSLHHTFLTERICCLPPVLLKRVSKSRS